MASLNKEKRKNTNKTAVERTAIGQNEQSLNWDQAVPDRNRDK